MSNLKLKLKKIDPVKAGIVYGAVLGLFGLVLAFFVFIFSSMIGAAGGMSPFGFFGGGLLTLIFLPIMYFIAGFIGGLIITLLLNFILKKTDGLTIDFEKIGESEDITMIGKQ
ncbi:hypothetical protein [uncultured Tenacibaculum sp.]|uniref:hypothetical protein n=1 Tax=uncultured Tenacibaculum sp. TaxID=174713 RepID=UPI00262C9914|nr:hypothetical protein [uncultured Tenacibaculum sp.]